MSDMVLLPVLHAHGFQPCMLANCGDNGKLAWECWKSKLLIQAQDGLCAHAQGLRATACLSIAVQGCTTPAFCSLMAAPLTPLRAGPPTRGILA